MAIEANSRSFWENYLLSAQLCAGEGLRSQAQLKTEDALATAHLRDDPDQEALLGQLNEEFHRAERDEAVFDALDAADRFADELRPTVLNLETCALCNNVFVRYFRARSTLTVTQELHDVVDRLWADPKTSDVFYGEMQALMLHQLRADEMQLELAEKNAKHALATLILTISLLVFVLGLIFYPPLCLVAVAGIFAAGQIRHLSLEIEAPLEEDFKVNYERIAAFANDLLQKRMPHYTEDMQWQENPGAALPQLYPRLTGALLFPKAAGNGNAKLTQKHITTALVLT